MYIREFVKLDDAINNTSKADIKGFSKNVAMAFNRMKQTIKKELKNAEFAQLVADFRANPIEESESEPEPSESESESESDSGSLYDSESESESGSGSESGSDSESGSEVSDSENSDSDELYYDESYYDSEAMSSDSDFSSGSDSSSSDSSSDSDEEPNPKLKGRAKWVLQPKDIEKQKKKEEEKKKKEEEKKRKDEERKKLDKEKSELSDAEADAEVVQKTYETPEKLMTAARSILETREKRSILSSLMCFLRLGASLVLQSFSELLPFAAELGVKYQLRILSHCIVSQLRSASRSGSLSPADWNGVFELIESMLSLAESHSTLALEFYNVYEAIRGTNTLESDLQDLAASDTPARIEGDLAQYVSQLAADYVRSQQQSDAHSTAYVTRLRDEVRLEGLAARVQRYYAAQPRLCVQMALLRVRLLYFSLFSFFLTPSHYLREPVYRALYATCRPGESLADLFATVRVACGLVYREGIAAQRLEAALYEIIHLAVNGRFVAARDVMLMAHVQERIVRAEDEQRLLFNRAMMHLGVAAFCQGSMVYAHNCLDDLVNLGTRSNQLRALVAQGSDAQDEETHALHERWSVPMHQVRQGRGMNDSGSISSWWRSATCSPACLWTSPPWSPMCVFVFRHHVQRSNIYKISAFFKRYYDRYRRHVFLRPDTDSLRVLAAYEAILVLAPRESHL